MNLANIYIDFRDIATGWIATAGNGCTDVQFLIAGTTGFLLLASTHS